MDSIRENNPFSKKFSLRIGSELKHWDRPLIMGILNLTPDSFFDGGKYANQAVILSHLERILKDGADIIDIGAFSSRPNAKLISEKEEKERLLEPLKWIRKEFDNCLISIDTYRAQVAANCLDEGANIINDISGGIYDPELPHLVAKREVPYVLMHMRGRPDNMQDLTDYDDVSREVFDWFSERLSVYRELGLKDIILDVGFGFGKELEHNYRLLKDLAHFKSLDCPILVGLSRKGMIQKVIGESADKSLNGTTAAHVIALLNGANMLRVHDVKAAKEAVQIVDYYQKQ